MTTAIDHYAQCFVGRPTLYLSLHVPNEVRYAIACISYQRDDRYQYMHLAEWNY